MSNIPPYQPPPPPGSPQPGFRGWGPPQGPQGPSYQPPPFQQGPAGSGPGTPPPAWGGPPGSSSSGYPQPLEPAPAPKKRRLLASTAIFVVVAGLAAAALAAFLFLRGTGDHLSKLAPSDTAVYVTVYTDPSGGQKLNLNNLLNKFPAASDATKRDQSINDFLDSALKDAGLTHSDVRDWLGAQTGFIVSAGALKSSGLSGGSPSVALLVSTKDDKKTTDALNKLKAGPAGAQMSFGSDSHGGVDITTISSRPQSPVTAAYAIVDHTLVVAGNVAYLDTIIDTDQGKQQSMEGTSDFSAVKSQLPSDELALVYLDMPQLSAGLKSLIQSSGAGNASTQNALKQLDALKGTGMAVSAQSDGFVLDVASDFDPGKLDDRSRQSLGISPHENSTAGLVPADRFAFGGLTGFQYLLQGASDALRQSSPSAAGTLDQIGLASILGHVTGDAGIEGGLAHDGKTPAAGLVVATDDEHAMRTFLDTAMPTLLGSDYTVKHETYKGADISEASRDSFGGDATTNPTISWTAVHGNAVIASSPDEVKAIIDTAGGAPNITSSSVYQQELGSSTKNNGELFIDVQKALSAIEANLPAGQKASFDRDVLPNLKPIQAIVYTQTSSSDHTSGHLLIAVH
jgi:hypothetical protein